jgi:hypothetical protein
MLGFIFINLQFALLFIAKCLFPFDVLKFFQNVTTFIARHLMWISLSIDH